MDGKIGELAFTSQTRLDFDCDRLLAMGVRRAYVTPFATNNESVGDVGRLLHNLELLAHKAKEASRLGLEVYPFFLTIYHPEGNYRLPSRYRPQSNMDGSPRPACVCFKDPVRQDEAIALAVRAAELGFARMAFDDDLRDAFCYCDAHLGGFAPFRDLTRQAIARILNDVFDHPEHEDLRRQWYAYKFEGMKDYAVRLEQAIHAANPQCRIGICTSAKRAHDFSGRSVWPWARLFHTEDAPVFVRLCGECYDDQLMHLAQSTGWHAYMDRCYPPQLERMAELTSVPAIGYRSPGTVLFEAQSVIASARVPAIHWCWTEEFAQTGLSSHIVDSHQALIHLHERVPSPPRASICLYIGQEAGPYTPPLEQVDYGQVHDPMTAYNITALTGVPIIPTPRIEADSQATVLCSAYMSREMIRALDDHMARGGVAILDAIAAQSYRIYGGAAQFRLDGPCSGHRYELAPGGEREDWITQCPPETIWLIHVESPLAAWFGYDIEGNPTGCTTALLAQGQGILIVLGFDLGLIGQRLVRPQWRERMLEMLRMAGKKLPLWWSGPPAVQVIDYGSRQGLINYNTQPVRGCLIVNGAAGARLDLAPREIRILDSAPPSPLKAAMNL